MSWLFIAVLIVLLWVVSLCTILYASSTPSTASFLSNSAGKRNVLLVIAHPDDESICPCNADGKGTIRKAELYQACAVLKVPLQQVKILDHPDLQDGFDDMRSHHLLGKIIEEEIILHDINLVIGITVMCASWNLISTSIARKYTGPVDIWLSIVYSLYYPKGEMYCLLNSPHKTYLAMAQHGSQWVWQKLFVLFSSYTYVNTVKKINI